MLDVCLLVNINCNTHRHNPAFSRFTNFNPRTKQGSVLIQLKFQNTNVSVARTMKTHMVLRAPLVKNQMKITCVPTTVQTLSKAQGPFPQEVVNHPGSRKEAKIDHFLLTTRKDSECTCRHRHTRKISLHTRILSITIALSVFGPQNIFFDEWNEFWDFQVSWRYSAWLPSTPNLGYTWFVVNLWYSYSLVKNLPNMSESELCQCLHNVKFNLGKWQDASLPESQQNHIPVSTSRKYVFREIK